MPAGVNLNRGTVERARVCQGGVGNVEDAVDDDAKSRAAGFNGDDVGIWLDVQRRTDCQFSEIAGGRVEDVSLRPDWPSGASMAFAGVQAAGNDVDVVERSGESGRITGRDEGRLVESVADQVAALENAAVIQVKQLTVNLLPEAMKRPPELTSICV